MFSKIVFLFAVLAAVNANAILQKVGLVNTGDSLVTRDMKGVNFGFTSDIANKDARTSHREVGSAITIATKAVVAAPVAVGYGAGNGGLGYGAGIGGHGYGAGFGPLGYGAGIGALGYGGAGLLGVGHGVGLGYGAGIRYNGVALLGVGHGAGLYGVGHGAGLLGARVGLGNGLLH